MAKSIKIGSGIDSIPTSTIPDDPTQFTSWFKNVYLKRWAANADVRNATPGTGVQISGTLNTPGFVGFQEISGNSVLGNATGVEGDVQAITAGADGEALQRLSGALVFAPISVISADSVTGAGTAASPLKLVNDLAAPAISQYYGTDVSGVLGYHTISTSTPALPGTIPDLLAWWESDNILGSANYPVRQLQERTPWVGGVFGYSVATSATNSPKIDSVLQNGLPMVKWQAAVVTGIYSLGTEPNTIVSTSPSAGLSFANGCTIFVVARGGATTLSQAILGCNTNAGVAIYITNAGVAKFQMVSSGVGAIAVSTTTWTTGVAFQANVTYNPTTGAWAVRQGRTAAGSGTGTTAVGSNSFTDRISQDQSFNSYLNLASLGAIICYDRVLTSTEITNVENYLFAKWGV